MRRALGFALLVAAFLPLKARAQTITAAPGGNMTSLVGMPFDVPFYVDMTARTEKLGAFAARVQWNPAVLSLGGGSEGSFGAVTVNEDSLAAGVARIAGANPAGVGGMITLGILHFTPLVAQADTIHLAVTELFAAGSFADLTPSLSTRSGFFCPARGMFGDIDKDGAINSRDALIALSNAVGLDVSAFDITLGDVDGNGATNARDALIILSSAVGLPVTSFQVGRLAGGACSSSLPLVMTILPDTVQLVVGQTVAFEARAADSSGALQTVTNAIWSSGNSAALAVFGDGTALARDTGTVRVTAVRTALDSARAVVHIIAHRRLQIVDAAAGSARNQLGSAAFPFARINQGIAFAQGGDTVEVRVGRYTESVQLDRAAVLMGDTLSDGTQPLVALDSADSYAGLLLTGPGARQVVNLSIGGYYDGVDVYGPSPVVLRGLRSTGATYGVVVDSEVGLLRVESSRLVGAGATNYGYGVETNAPVDTLVVQGSEISDFGYDGIYAIAADSVAVLQSAILDVGDYGIEVRQSGGCEFECAAPAQRGAALLGPLAPAFTLSGSTIARTGSYVVYLDPIRSASFSHNHLSNPGDYGVHVYGNNAGWVKVVGDSMDVYEDWLYAEYLDSLSVDSAWVRSPEPYGETYDVFTVRVTNTQFVNAQETALNVSFGGVTYGGRVFLDNVSVLGDPTCDLCAEVLEAYGPRVTANRITGVNLYRGFDVSGDSSMTLTNSTFRHVEYPVEWYGSYTDSTSRLAINHTTFSGFYKAIQAYDGGLRVDSSSFVNGTDYGVYFEGSGPVRISQNAFASVSSPIQLDPYSTYGGWVDTVAANTITDLSYEGIYVDADDTVPFRILGNALTCNRAGRTNGYAIELNYASGVIASNQVNGCYSGIHVYDDNGASLRADSVRVNNLMVPSSAYQYQGILVDGSIKANIAGNVLTADTSGSSWYGVIAMYGFPGATATIDSNTVTGGTSAGIYAAYLDTALVRYNTVQGVKSPYSNQGAINLDGGLANLALIYGNQVRQSYGNGIRIYNSDTAMVQVDANLVTGSSADGVRMDGGADLITRNRIVNNGIGVEFASYSVDQRRSLVSGNNIVGNLFGLMQGLDASLTATNNWWGDAKGPSCRVTAPCGDSSVVGDSVYGANFIPFATAEIGGTPSPAVLALPILALRVPVAARAIEASAPTGLDAPVAKQALVARATSPARSPRALSTAARVPAGLKPAQAQLWQRAAALRTSALAVATQRAQARAARAQVRTQAQQALVQRLEQRKAQLETRRQAKQARQAAARAARPHVVPQ